MNKKIVLTMTLLLSSFSYTASAQHYSLYEVKKMKEGRTVLSKRPFLWIGKANQMDKISSASESASLKYGTKKACQYAAIKALADLQKQAKKKNYLIVKNIHSPKTRPGFFYCNIGWQSATVKLNGTFTKK